MTDSAERLELLITRFIDGEISALERRELQALLRRDPNAESLFEQTLALDREVGRALRQASGRTSFVLRPARGWTQFGRFVAAAAAACLGGALWLNPDGIPRVPGDSQKQQHAGSAWFAPPPGMADSYRESAGASRGALERAPQQLIVIPGDRPGEFLVVEVKRMETRPVRVGQDY